MENILVEMKNFTISTKFFFIMRELRYGGHSKTILQSYKSYQELVGSIFHGPRVEGSFSRMKDIIKVKSGSMSVATFSSLQTIK